MSSSLFFAIFRQFNYSAIFNFLPMHITFNEFRLELFILSTLRFFIYPFSWGGGGFLQISRHIHLHFRSGISKIVSPESESVISCPMIEFIITIPTNSRQFYDIKLYVVFIFFCQIFTILVLFPKSKLSE